MQVRCVGLVAPALLASGSGGKNVRIWDLKKVSDSSQPEPVFCSSTCLRCSSRAALVLPVQCSDLLHYECPFVTRASLLFALLGAAAESASIQYSMLSAACRAMCAIVGCSVHLACGWSQGSTLRSMQGHTNWVLCVSVVREEDGWFITG